MRITGTCVLVLSVLAFAGSAYAGNGNENGNGNGKGNGGGAAESSPGNSASAPGQQKKDDQPASQQTTTATTVATTTTTAAQTTTTSNAGVKPSNSTAHDTNAEAQSNKTKQYGNGQTAGQVAEKNGASGSTNLHGPGNSQPHKAAPCSGGHEVDVHALKGKHSANCGSTPDPKPNPKPTPDPVPDPKPDPGPTPPTTTTTTSTTTTTTPTTPTTTTPGSEPDSPRGGHSSTTHGVLSSTQAAGEAATLPFTGQALWVVVLAGIVLIATGLALRQIRTDEACVESGHDHTDRVPDAAPRSRRPFGGRSGR